MGATSDKSGACSSTIERWLFSVERLQHTPSHQDGFDVKKEIRYRQQAAGFIQEMGERLNHNVRDHRGRISQLCMCAAMIHMHRFFVFHSFKIFDPRDIGAACLFLAGKSEECPRKLEHIVKVWWILKHPNSSNLDANSDIYMDAAQLIVTYENILLQTIAFDLQVDVPHPHVLNAMQKIVRGNKNLTETAYYFASDILHMTNWGVRYSSQTLACVCIQMSCIFSATEIPNSVTDGRVWHEFVDKDMTKDSLNVLTAEFIKIYNCNQNMLNIKRHRKSVQCLGQSSIGVRPSNNGANNSKYPDKSIEPVLAQKRVDISQYKEMRKNVVPTTCAGPPRKNFMPDIDSLSTREPILPSVKPTRKANNRHKEEEKEQEDRKRPFDEAKSKSASEPSSKYRRTEANNVGKHHHHHAHHRHRTGDDKNLHRDLIPTPHIISTPNPRPVLSKDKNANAHKESKSRNVEVGMKVSHYILPPLPSLPPPLPTLPPPPPPPPPPDDLEDGEIC